MQSRIYSVQTALIENLIVIPERPRAVVVSAKGTVVTLGWTQADLVPWMYIVRPKDGILDLDFVATPPTENAIQLLSPIGVLKAFSVPNWLRGIRVHSSQNEIETMLAEDILSKNVASATEGWPLPWPFPWWSPGAEK
jgi:hypothetical protein